MWMLEGAEDCTVGPRVANALLRCARQGKASIKIESCIKLMTLFCKLAAFKIQEKRSAWGRRHLCADCSWHSIACRRPGPLFLATNEAACQRVKSLERHVCKVAGPAVCWWKDIFTRPENRTGLRNDHSPIKKAAN